MSSASSDQADSDGPLFIVNIIDVPRVHFSSQIINNVQTVQDTMQSVRDEHIAQLQIDLTADREHEAENASARIGEFPSASAIICSNNEELSDLTTCFENSQQARLYHQTLIPVHEEEDATLPTTENQKRALVHVLTTAFKSIEHATDNQKELELFLKLKHDIRLVEIVCWRVLEVCIDRSRRGPLCKGFNKDRTKSATTPMSFIERFDNAVKVMVLYKGCCKNLFKPLFIDEFIDNPLFHLGRAVTNKRGNANRQTQIKLGKAMEETVGNGESSNENRTAQKISRTIHQEDFEQSASMDQTSNVGEDSPSPPKRRRQGSKAKITPTKTRATPVKKKKDPSTSSVRKRVTRSSRAVSDIIPFVKDIKTEIAEEGQDDMLGSVESTQEMALASSPPTIQDHMAFPTPVSAFSAYPGPNDQFLGFPHSASMPSFTTSQPGSFSSFVGDFYHLTPFPSYDGFDIDGYGIGDVHHAEEDDFKSEEHPHFMIGFNDKDHDVE